MNLHIIVLFKLLVIINISANADPYWISQPSPTTQRLTGCQFVNSNTGWICGDSGFIAKTSNSGNSWTRQSTGINKEIYSIYFLNERLGWGLALNEGTDTLTFPGTIILKTTDGGANWSAGNYPDTNFFYKEVFFLDSLRGFMGGYPKFILSTTNGGLTWSEPLSDSVQINGFPVEEISFLNDQFGCAAGGIRDLGGLIWRTTNSGLSWKPVVVGPDPVHDVYISDINNAIGVCGDFKFGANYFSTSTGGLHWQVHDLGYFGIVEAIDFRTESEGWLTLGYGEKFYITTNAGSNWTQMDTPDSSAIFDIQFLDSANGWAVGNFGRILKYNLMVSIIENNNSVFDPHNFVLHQNYPNPFNSKTITNYELRITSFVSLKIFDVLGNEVALIVNEKKNPGSYKVQWDATNYSSGIYYYQISVDGFLQSKKMILLK